MDEIKITEELDVPDGDDHVLALVMIDESGIIHWMRTLNNPSIGMEEYFREDISINGNLGDSKLSAGVYKAKFVVRSGYSYEGEYDSEMDMVDEKLIVLAEDLEQQANA